MATTSVRPPAQQFGPVPRRFWAPGLDLFDVLGQIVLFSVSALRSLPRALRYRKEIWWYAAFLALGSTPVALVMTYFSGSECSVEAYYSLHQLGGAESLAGVFNVGTMRINEEIDALETMGVPSIPFLVTTRMLAALLVLPVMYVLALATSFFASWVVQRFQIGLVSNGVYFSYFWRFTNLTDFGYSLIKAVIFAFLVISVGVYYGYHVKGGAVGIGRAVAKTMAISLVMIVVVNAILTQIFWGTNPNLPIPS